MFCLCVFLCSRITQKSTNFNAIFGGWDVKLATADSIFAVIGLTVRILEFLPLWDTAAVRILRPTP